MPEKTTQRRSRKGVGGRPSDYTPELAGRICEELAAGRSLRDVCKLTWAPVQSTVFRWLAKHEEFRKQYAAAREMGAERRAVEILELADEEPMIVVDQNGVSRVDSGWVQWQKLRIDSRKWELSKLLPKKYGDRVDLNHGVQPDSPLADLLAHVAGHTLRPKQGEGDG